jgi:hypothetical protein
MTRATIQAIEPGSGPAGLRRNWTRLSDERAATSPPPLWATESTQVVRAPLSAACDDVGGAKEQGRVPLPWMGRGQGWGENAGKRPMRWHASSAAAGRREERRGMVALASPTPSPSPRHVEDMPSAWWGGESGRICGAVTVSIDRRDRRNKMCEHPSLVGEGQGGGIPGQSGVVVPPTPNPSPQGGGESGRTCGAVTVSSSRVGAAGDRRTA